MIDFARYYFIPSTRQGLAAAIKGDATGARAVFTANLQISGSGFNTGEPKPIPKDLELYGPGDILGFDARNVARTDPRENVGDFESNYFPMIEFAAPDFPWRYTPAQFDNTNGKLTPWIALIVLIAENSGTAVKEYEEGNRAENSQIPYIIVKSTYALPDLEAAWRWAHVQLTTDDAIQDQDLKSELENAVSCEPERVVSRLLCPRRLRPGVLYHAFVVPTFELGRKAGLGLSPDDGDRGLTLAWNRGTSGTLKLPYYYKWEFRTGLLGDFEHLVRLLEARQLEDLGLRDMDCGNPGFGLKDVLIREDLSPDDPGYRVLEMEGALKSTDTGFTAWGKDPEQSQLLFLEPSPISSPNLFQLKLAEILNQPKADELTAREERPVVGPPVYGRWHRGRPSRTPEQTGYVYSSPDANGWIDVLNLDPRHRAAAGLGTEVVKKQQEALMASAWKQIGAVLEANEMLRRAQFGREVSLGIEKRLKTLPLCDYLRSTSAMFSRVILEDTAKTIHKEVNESRLPAALFDPAFRRIARKRGSVRRRQKSDGEPRADIVQRFNEQTISPAGPHPKPGGMLDICEVTDTLIDLIPTMNQPPKFTSQPTLVSMGSYKWKLDYKITAEDPNPDQALSLKTTSQNVPAEWHLTEPEELGAGSRQWKMTADLSAPSTVQFNGGDEVRPIPGIDLPIPYIYTITIEVTDSGIPRMSQQQVITLTWDPRMYTWEVKHENRDVEVSSRFCSRNITRELLSDIEVSPADAPIEEALCDVLDGFLSEDKPRAPLPDVDLDKIRDQLQVSLDPEKTIANRVKRRFDAIDVAQKKDELSQIMAAPEFPQPMYEPLRELSQDLILPGLETVPQNTIALLETNGRFVESYMVGLNHEFARELLWREYPTDQRGSYFRQFWDVRSHVPSEQELNDLLTNYLKEFQVSEVKDLPQEEQDRILKRYKSSDQTDIAVENLIKEQELSEKYKVITRIHTWKDRLLGSNDNRPGENLVLLIRGDLLKRYPETVIYAVKATADNQPVGSEPVHNEPVPDLPEYTGEDVPGQIKHPIFSGTLPPDVTFLGFDLDKKTAWGCEGELGWYFVLEERVSEARFGLDTSSKNDSGTFLEDPILRDDLSWSHFGLGSDSDSDYDTYLDDAPVTSLEINGDLWKDDSSSALRAKITLQKPVRIAIHARQMLPEGVCDEA